MPRLFTYIIPYDNGAAPNPYWGVCTLNICKPKFRSTAKESDWVAAFGSKNAPSGNLSGKLVYAMKVTEVLSMKDYDAQTPKRFPKKRPTQRSPDWRYWLGDSIYDFSSGSPKQRKGVHGSANQPNDISGKNCLLSNHFIYFGKSAVLLPKRLTAIVPSTQGHKSDSNDSCADDFVVWIEDQIKQAPRSIQGEPDGKVASALQATCGASCRVDEAEEHNCYRISCSRS